MKDARVIGICKHGKAVHYAYPCKMCFFEQGLTVQDYYARLESLRDYHRGKAIDEIAAMLDNL